MSLLDSFFSSKDVSGNGSTDVLREILETMREAALIVGEDMRILAANGAAVKAFGRRTASLVPRRLSEIIRDLTLHESVRRVIAENGVREILLTMPGIERRKFDVHIAPVRLAEKRAAICIFYDVTKIEHLERVRQEFLSNISHELRTPLTSILAFVETLEDGAIDDAENNRHFLSVIRKNAERMHHLIDDILELSSIESGKIVIRRGEIDLGLLVREVFTNLSNKAAVREIELVSEVPEGCCVFADVKRLEQMLTNLIDNAVKFNVRGGKVTVGCERDGSSDIITVSDTGEGISNEHLRRIFERFYRADRARSREIGGTGLGLAIVKHLTRLHGGEIAVESSLGKGTTFRVELPVVL